MAAGWTDCGWGDCRLLVSLGLYGNLTSLIPLMWDRWVQMTFWVVWITHCRAFLYSTIFFLKSKISSLVLQMSSSKFSSGQRAVRLFLLIWTLTVVFNGPTMKLLSPYFTMDFSRCLEVQSWCTVWTEGDWAQSPWGLRCWELKKRSRDCQSIISKVLLKGSPISSCRMGYSNLEY